MSFKCVGITHLHNIILKHKLYLRKYFRPTSSNLNLTKYINFNIN